MVTTKHFPITCRFYVAISPPKWNKKSSQGEAPTKRKVLVGQQEKQTQDVGSVGSEEEQVAVLISIRWPRHESGQRLPNKLVYKKLKYLKAIHLPCAVYVIFNGVGYVRVSFCITFDACSPDDSADANGYLITRRHAQILILDATKQLMAAKRTRAHLLLFLSLVMIMIKGIIIRAMRRAAITRMRGSPRQLRNRTKFPHLHCTKLAPYIFHCSRY